MNLRSVADVVDPHPSHRAPPKFDGGIPFVGIGDVSTDDKVDFSRARLVSPKILEEHRQRYSLDDSLIGLGRVASVGKVVRLPNSSYTYVVSPTLAVVRPFDVDYEFLYYALQSPNFQAQLNSNKQGSGRESVGITRLRVLEIPIPPQEEQKRVVEILKEQISRLDAALESVSLIREKAARFRRSLLHAAFTGELSGHVLSEKSLSDGWRHEAISDIAIGGLFVDGDWVESKDQDPSGSVRLTQLADVGEGVFRDRSDRWMREDQAARLGVTYLAEGDLLIARMPEPLGRCCLVPPISAPSVTVVDVAVLRLDQSRYNSNYVMWILNSPAIRQAIERESSGTTRVRISRKNLGTIKIPVPPYSEQNAIVAILEEQFTRLDASMKLADAIESKASALKRSLLHSAFTGELTKEWREGAHV